MVVLMSDCRSVIAVVCRSACAVTRLPRSVGQRSAATLDVLVDQPFDGVAAEPPAADSGEQRVLGHPVAFFEPDSERLDRLGDQRHGAFLAVFPDAVEVGASAPLRMSWQRRPVSSETRSPVWIAVSSSAWSRRPAQVVRSGRRAARRPRSW